MRRTFQLMYAAGMTAAVHTAGAAPATAQAQAQAQTIPFEGTRENVNPLLPPGSGRCVPPYFNTVEIAPGNLSSTGASNLGSFTSTQSHCITSVPPTSVVDGRFTYSFRGGDTITGTYSGNVAATGTPGSFAATENLTITGGTGRFVGASGTINSNGTLALGGGNGTFSGTVRGGIVASTATASGRFATAVGAPSAATGDYATAYGALSLASGERSLAVGSQAEATAVGAVAVGDGTYASGPAAMAIGQFAAATSAAATAVGHNTVASGMASFAGGVRAQATGAGATALGRMAAATGATSTALGANAVAAQAGATAVGFGATTTAANQVALGGTGSAVRIGDIAASTAAQQAASVGIATVDANGVLGRNTTLQPAVAALQSASTSQAGQITALQATAATQGQAITTLQGDMTRLFDLRDADRRAMRRGVAAAVAIAQASMPSAPGRTSYILNGATFRGEWAIGGSLMHRFDTEVPIALTAGFSAAGRGDNAFRAGVAGEF